MQKAGERKKERQKDETGRKGVNDRRRKICCKKEKKRDRIRKSYEERHRETQRCTKKDRKEDGKINTEEI